MFIRNKILFIIFILSLFISNISYASGFEKFYIEKDLYSEDSVIVENRWGDRYLVEYGIGCLGIWRYEWRDIYIDIGGTFLDGIGDTIHLPDSDDSCSVWDVTELDSSSYSHVHVEEAIESLCGENSLIDPNDGMCFCKVGYELNSSENGCVEKQLELPPKPKVKTKNEICQDSFGSHSSWNNESGDEVNCICNDGYNWAEDNSKCIEYTTSSELQNNIESDVSLIIKEETLFKKIKSQIKIILMNLRDEVVIFFKY